MKKARKNSRTGMIIFNSVNCTLCEYINEISTFIVEYYIEYVTLGHPLFGICIFFQLQINFYLFIL